MKLIASFLLLFFFAIGTAKSQAGNSVFLVYQSGDCGRHRLQGVLSPVRAGDSLPIPGLGHSRPPRVRVRRIGRPPPARRGGVADGPKGARSNQPADPSDSDRNHSPDSAGPERRNIAVGSLPPAGTRHQ